MVEDVVDDEVAGACFLLASLRGLRADVRASTIFSTGQCGPSSRSVSPGGALGRARQRAHARGRKERNGHDSLTLSNTIPQPEILRVV